MSTVPVKINEVDKITKPKVEEKVKAVVSKDENDLKEAEGIINWLIILFGGLVCTLTKSVFLDNLSVQCKF